MLPTWALGLMLALLMVFGTAGPADAKQWQVGDKVQAYNVDWYNGTIAEVGTGSYQGYYLIKWDDFAGRQYIAEANIRARPGTAPSAWSTDRAALDNAMRRLRPPCAERLVPRRQASTRAEWCPAH